MGYDPFAGDVHCIFPVRLDGCGQRLFTRIGPFGKADAGYYDGGVRIACSVGFLGAAVTPFYGNAFCIVSGFMDTGDIDQRHNALFHLPQDAAESSSAAIKSALKRF